MIFQSEKEVVHIALSTDVLSYHRPHTHFLLHPSFFEKEHLQLLCRGKLSTFARAPLQIYKIPDIVFTIPNLHFLDIRDPIAMLNMGWSCLMVSILYGIVFFAMVHMRHLIHLQQHLAAISPATKDMHRTLYISLFFQVSLLKICIK